MEIIRRNTDYSLRMMVALAKHSGSGELMSASRLVREGNISYDVGRKLLQKLREAGMVKTVRGSKGGFTLNRKPSEISLMAIINILQGTIYLNKCLVNGEKCEFEPKCEVNTTLTRLQRLLTSRLESVTLEKILKNRNKKAREWEGNFQKNNRNE